MEDDDEKYDLFSKRKTGGLSDFDRAMMVQSSASDEPASSSKPSWAAAYEAAEAAKKKRKPTRLSGTVIKWNKGFGFIKVPGQADLYVHQRNVLKKGFRSLLEGEPVEFEMAKMPDGKLEALNVSGPGGAEPAGQPTPAEREEEEEEERARALKEQQAQAERPKKPVVAFVPRTVKRAAPKPAARPGVTKPANGSANAPVSTAPASGAASASSAPAAAPAAPYS